MSKEMAESTTFRRGLALLTALVVALGPVTAPVYAATRSGSSAPIQHLVVVFQENISFDHYFGTYPNATNPAGEPVFYASRRTPPVNGLTKALLNNNPNLNPANLPGAANPFRLDRTQAVTADQDHDYTAEQKAFDMGLMDLFPLNVGTAGPPPSGAPITSTTGLNMGYFDGNTVTALWNYAQRFAMSDNSYSTTFGPSSPGAINLVSGDTGGVDMTHTANNPSIATPASPNADLTADGQGGFSLTSDAQPYWDDCSTRDAVAMSGQNVGDLLNAKGLSWGWFQGGFRPSTPYTTALADIQVTQPTSTFVVNQFKTLGAKDPNVVA